MGRISNWAAHRWRWLSGKNRDTHRDDPSTRHVEGPPQEWVDKNWGLDGAPGWGEPVWPGWGEQGWALWAASLGRGKTTWWDGRGPQQIVYVLFAMSAMPFVWMTGLLLQIAFAQLCDLTRDNGTPNILDIIK